MDLKKRNEQLLKIILVASLPEKKMEYEGFKHFLEHMAFGGSKKLKSTELNVKSYQLGGIMGAFTGSEFMGFHLEIFKKDFNLMLEYLNQIVFHPTYPDKKIVKEKIRMIDEIMGNLTRESGYLTIKYMDILYRDSIYDYWGMGLATHIKKITRDDLLAFHRKYFNAQNTKIFYYLSLGLDIDYINNYMDYINAVTLNDIKRVSKIAISSEKFVEVII